MWYILFGWFASLVIFKSRIMNFFRIQCTYDRGQYVQVEKAEPGKTIWNIYMIHPIWHILHYYSSYFLGRWRSHHETCASTRINRKAHLWVGCCSEHIQVGTYTHRHQILCVPMHTLCLSSRDTAIFSTRVWIGWHQCWSCQANRRPNNGWSCTTQRIDWFQLYQRLRAQCANGYSSWIFFLLLHLSIHSAMAILLLCLL